MIFAALHPFTQFSWLKWSIHPSTVIGLGVLAALYVWRASRGGPDERTSGARKLSFFSALFVIFASLNGPIHDLADNYLFSGHMVQHLLLTMLMPPLLIAGVPGWMLRPLLANRIIGAIARKLTRPFACFLIFNVVIAAWHVPALYNAAMVNHDIHAPFYFKWQGAYGAFSVSKRHVPLIRDYVLRQEEHHRDLSLYPLLEPPLGPEGAPVVG